MDASGNVYVADSNNNTIRKITSAGVVTTLVGSAGSAGYVDGTGSAARLWYPHGLTVDVAGNVFVSDTTSGSSTIRKITPAGVVTTIAGTSFNEGYSDGVGSAVRFDDPTGVAVDPEGNVVVADTSNRVIRKIAATGVVTTIAGRSDAYGSVDGSGSVARFSGFTEGVTIDAAGTVYVVDSDNEVVRKITPAGVVSTLAGLAGSGGSVDGLGSAAKFDAPNGIAVDGAGNLFVADLGNATIRKITPVGLVTTFAGLAKTRDSIDGVGSAARFTGPHSVAVDRAGNVYVTDNNTIRRITPAGAVSTFAGMAGSLDFLDGTGGAARFYYPEALAIDGADNLYVSDYYTIRKITPAGVVTTLAGSAGDRGSVDGTGSAALFSDVQGLAADGAGNIYVADTYSSTIRRITPAGVVTTLGGEALKRALMDGSGRQARFSVPRGIAVDGSGNLYITDTTTIRKGSLDRSPMIATQPLGLNVFVGQSVSFSVTVAGVNPASNTYQWTMNGVNIPGSTSLTHTIAGVSLSDAGSYALVITNPFGSVTSSPAILTVTRPSADLNADYQADLVWQNTTSGVRRVWLMNGTAKGSEVTMTTWGTDWQIVGTADFNGDNKPDVLWQNTTTGERTLSFMNGTNIASELSLAIVDPAWNLGGVADLNGDSNPDLIWENTLTGERGIWLMNGTARVGWASLGTLAIQWNLAGAGDFNADGKPDLVWQNTLTGERKVWLMNGSTKAGEVSLGFVALEWNIGSVADYNGDGNRISFGKTPPRASG